MDPLSRPFALLQRTWRKGKFAPVLTLALGLGACSGPQRGDEPEKPASETPPVAEEPAEPIPEPDPEIVLGPLNKHSMREHRAGFAFVFEGDTPRKMNVGEAEGRGYTVIDLSDDWAPYIFTEKTPGEEDATPNLYRARYIDLANDRTDSDGDPLPAHGHNFLELYGIPPSFTVVLEEWKDIEDNVEPCLASAGYDPEVFTRYRKGIAYKKGEERRFVKPASWAKGTLEKNMRRAGLDPESAADMEAAKSNPKTKNAYAAWRKHQDPLDVIVHAQKRFRCEQLYATNAGVGTTQDGSFDSATTHALAAFEKKHALKGWGHFTVENIDYLSLTPRQAMHSRALRVLEERVVSAAGIVEDGSAAQWKPKFRYKDAEGNSHALVDAATAAREAASAALGLHDEATAHTALSNLGHLQKKGFETLLVAVKLPDKPAYYTDNMDFEALIDRGDVWYDFPYDDEGNKQGQPRKRYPHLTLYTNYLDQKIPLVHWRTTIGSWRSETKEGEVFYKYKNSDVGERVWKNIMAAPAWIPPESTPEGELLKRKYVGNELKTVVNYDEIGPGYRSAYGLVAAYHIRQHFDEEGNVRAELDNQIRTHGSVDYMSIMRRYSHGCHRLYNMNAVRLFSFILRHRPYTRQGQQEVGFRRAFEHEGEPYKMRIDSRGYRYELVTPIKVMVTEGRVRGSRKSPYEDYKKKPGVEYGDDEASGDPTEAFLPFPSFGL